MNKPILHFHPNHRSDSLTICSSHLKRDFISENIVYPKKILLHLENRNKFQATIWVLYFIKKEKKDFTLLKNKKKKERRLLF